ncbi:hypothetical protein QBC39DRAFT_343127 [Podospora conica]|nr:hypothetical protein QBC39DRAFT_343127 [Schizothecium conicum]
MRRPRHVPGYVAKVVAADPDAVAALAATIVKLAKDNNSNIVLAWFEFPGKTDESYRSNTGTLATYRPDTRTHDSSRSNADTYDSYKSNTGTYNSYRFNAGTSDSYRDLPRWQDSRVSVDNEPSRSKKPRLSDDVNAPLARPAPNNDHKFKPCRNCQSRRHDLAICPKPCRFDGSIMGCPRHNTTSHSLDYCYQYRGKTLSDLPDSQVLDLYLAQVVHRAKKPAIRSLRFFWLDCLQEAFKRKLISVNNVHRPATSDLPWTDEFAIKVAMHPNGPLGDTKALAELYTAGDHSPGF